MKILLRPLLVLLLAPYAIEARYLTNDGPPENQSQATFDPDLDRFIVRYKNEHGKSSAHSAATRVHADLGPQKAVAVTLSSKAWKGLQKNPNIDYVEQDHPRYSMMMRGYHSNDVFNEHMVDKETHGDNHRKLTQTVPYGIPMVQADQVAPGPNPIKVCIIDSGFSSTHEDLGLTDVTGYDNPGSGSWDVDRCAHGTHVAGTIAAMDNDLGVIGVYPNAHLHIVKVFGVDRGNPGCRWSYDSDLIAAANECADANANVISMSLGGSYNSTTENDAFAALFASNILIVAAAGNSGDTSYSFPASYDSVMSVAAINVNKDVASFSQQNNQVDIAAPGVSVRSTVPGTGTYADYSGTSMATPHVSAVAALIWSHDATKTASEVREALQSTAEDLGENGIDNAYGYGLVQAAAACDTLTGSSCPSAPADNPTAAPFAANPTAAPFADDLCSPQDDSCVDDGDCCSLSCKGKTGSKSCKGQPVDGI